MVEVRNRLGQPIVYLNIRLSLGDLPSDAAYDDRFTDLAGHTAWPNPLPSPNGYTLYFNYANLQSLYGNTSVRIASFDEPVNVVMPWAGEVSPVPDPGDDGTSIGELTSTQRVGTSLYGGFGDPGWDLKQFLRILADNGQTLTRWWLMVMTPGDPWRGLLPFHRPAPGARWDLFQWRQEFFDTLGTMVRYANRHGIVVQLSLHELYTWYRHKQGLPGISDVSTGPFRHNVNGFSWTDDDALVLEVGGAQAIPNKWCVEFYTRCVEAVQGTAVLWEIGNEFPERALHYRVRDTLERLGVQRNRITVSRNHDAPSQFLNMNIGTDFSRIVFHNWRNMAALNTVWQEGESGRPDTHVKMLDFLSAPQRERIIVSSDGARVSGATTVDGTYDYPRLLQAFEYAKQRGCSIEHQSQAKMQLFLHGNYDLKVETSFLQQLASL